MDKVLLQKLIKSHNETCPEFIYENAVIDKDVAKALSKSFVQLLSNKKSIINNNLRNPALENIRKMCQTETENHVKVNETMVGDLVKLYSTQINSDTNSKDIVESVNKQLDDFLTRQIITSNFNCSFKSSANPDVMKALLNLNKDELFLNILTKNVIYWNETDEKFIKLLKSLWNNDLPLNSIAIDDISLKLKSEIERILLEFCFIILTVREENLKDCFVGNKELMDISKKCSVSKKCFQICCNVLNFLFIVTNFDSQLEKFIQFFLKEIKSNRERPVSVLYPLHLTHIAVLMDFEIDTLPEPVKKVYTKPALDHLDKLHNECVSGLVMLLSHYPQWFNLYFEFHNKQME